MYFGDSDGNMLPYSYRDLNTGRRCIGWVVFKPFMPNPRRCSLSATAIDKAAPLLKHRENPTLPGFGLTRMCPPIFTPCVEKLCLQRLDVFRQSHLQCTAAVLPNGLPRNPESRSPVQTPMFADSIWLDAFSSPVPISLPQIFTMDR